MGQPENGFCGSCGAGLIVKNPKMCVKCGADPKVPDKFCPYCGAKLSAATPELCTKCGSSLKQIGEKKDSGIAILISIVGFLFLANPAIGYFVIGKTRKGIEYFLLLWAIPIALMLLWLFGGALTGGVGLLCLPILGLPLVLLYIGVFLDIYKIAEGKEAVLPEI